MTRLPMKLVIDSNVLFAALLKDSNVRTALVFSNHLFFIPAYVLQELEEHEEELLVKTTYSKEELKLVISSTLQRLSVIKDALIQKEMEKAKGIMDRIDPDDTPIIAAALAIQADGIVTFDPHFRQQNSITIFDVDELLPSGEL